MTTARIRIVVVVPMIEIKYPAKACPKRNINSTSFPQFLLTYNISLIYLSRNVRFFTILATFFIHVSIQLFICKRLTTLELFWLFSPMFFILTHCF